MFDQVHPGSAADHFEPFEGGYRLTPRSGFVNLIGKYQSELDSRDWFCMDFALLKTLA